MKEVLKKVALTVVAVTVAEITIGILRGLKIRDRIDAYVAGKSEPAD
jgi:hypothetical protein